MVGIVIIKMTLNVLQFLDIVFTGALKRDWSTRIL